MATIDLATYKASFEIDDSGLKTGLSNADKTLRSESSKFSKWFKVGLAGTMAAVGAAVGVAAKQSADAFIEFEDGMNTVFTLLPDISGQAMGEMSDQVKQLSKDMGVLPDEVIPALYQSLSASVPKDNVFEFLEVAQKGAIAGITETETVVGGLTTVLNSYHKEATEADKVSDILFQTIKYGKTSMEELSSSMSQVTPVASNLGVEFEDIGAALATMTAQGNSTASSSVQLRQMFNELSKEGTKTSDLFKEIAGKSFKEFIAEGNNVQDALQLLEEHAKDNNVEINDLFSSVQAGQAALLLTGGATEMFANNLENMANSAGATDDAFNTMENSVKRNIDKIKANMEVIKIELGESLAPAVRSITDYIVDAMPTIQAIVETTFAVIGDVIKVFIDVIGWLVDNIKIMVSDNEESFTEMKETIDGIFGAIRELFSVFVDFATRIWDKYGQDIVEFTKRYWGYIQNYINGVLNIIKGIIDFFTALFKGDWEGMGQALAKITENFWGLIKNAFTAAIDVLKTILKLATNVFKDLGKFIMEGLWTGFKFIWDKITEWFAGVFKGLFSWFGGLGSSFINIGKDMLNWVWDGMKGIWTSISSWISDTVSWLADKLAFWRRGKNEMDVPVTDPSANANIPSYSVGTPFIPTNQLAFVHRGEAIIPAHLNPWNSANKNNGNSIANDNRNIYNIQIDKVITEDAESFVEILPTLANQY